MNLNNGYADDAEKLLNEKNVAIKERSLKELAETLRRLKGTNNKPKHRIIVGQLEKIAVDNDFVFGNTTRKTPSALLDYHLKEIRRGNLPKFVPTYLAWLWCHHRAEAEKFYSYAKLPLREYVSHAGAHVSLSKMSSALATRVQAIEDIMTPLLESHVPHELEDDFLNYVKKKNSGYWVLTAGPGMGKSAIMASLASRLGADYATVPYFFQVNGNRPRSNGPLGFYDYLFQWTSHVFEEDASAHEHATDLESYAEAFWQFVHDLADKGKISGTHKLVLCIDALDENNASFAPNDNPNPLCLPDVLPTGVIVAYSIRLSASVADAQDGNSKNHRHIKLDITDNLPEHVAAQKHTVAEFVWQECQANKHISAYHGEDASALSNTKRDAFVDKLCHNAQYNFMILKCVLRDDDYWERYEGQLKLNGNLTEYYKNHLARMTERWKDTTGLQAVFCFAMEPRLSSFSFQRLLASDGNPDAKERTERLLNQWTRQGLFTRHHYFGWQWYEPYHETYKTFLRQQFEQQDRASFLKPYADNLCADLDLGADTLADQVQDHVSGNLPVREEIVRLMLRLNLYAFQMMNLSKMLPNLAYWKMVASGEQGFAGILPFLKDVKPETVEQTPNVLARNRLHEIFVTAAKSMRDWAKNGLLFDHANQPISWTSLRKIAKQADPNAHLGGMDPHSDEALSFSKYLIHARNL